MTIDQRLHAAGAAVNAHAARAPLTPLRPRRRPRRIVATAAAAAVVAVAVVGLVLLRPAGRPASIAAGSRLVSDPDAGFSIRLPVAWHLADSPLTGWESELVAAGTGVLTPNADLPAVPGYGCAHLPRATFQTLDTDVAFAIVELSEGPTGRARPAFDAWQPVDREQVAPQCFPPSLRFRLWFDEFDQNGRSFYVYAAAGPNADPGSVAEMWDALDSFAPSSAGAD
jgi:hypothetical protein